uniref:Methyltransferase domain-containing protein n=1 Tax=Chromera velia CCMP2878 TaxID=1169474 RepID=A0A0G4HB76_9ALVE|eukprot:Cvel_25873.t1-p1 / transcript=Cvel_25873.t1 / gene=Cvel_25873 / organism=Chromera_velia_CCMP2878 / gene_product=hypothetical protein / transcript_product=hypothetical protein / location=Cvel_scaffold2986:7820-15698(-) / protein_length=419 / sequence_SO=supercontig / SO=protein_coding / is_pseudo=false
MEGTGGSKTLGNGAAAAGAADDLIWAVYPPPLPFSYQEGDPVFVFLKTQKDDGAGVLESNRIEDPCEIAHASGGGTKKLSAGRYLVRFDSDGSRAHVRPERMIPKFPNGRRFPVKRIGWIVPETTHFRELIRSQVTHTDLALEVGCSTGHATEKLAKKAKFAVGVDVSLHIIQKARARFPRVRFEHLNIFDDEDLESLAQLYAEKQNEQREEKEEGEGVKEDSGLVIFLDIGGNRPIPDRLRGLRVLLLRFRPRLVCVKSRDLFRSAVESLGREVATLPCGRFVGQRVESLWQSSLSQSARFRFSRERFSNGSLQWKENLKGGKKGGGKSVTGGVIVGRGGSETGATATTIEERGVRVWTLRDGSLIAPSWQGSCLQTEKEQVLKVCCQVFNGAMTLPMVSQGPHMRRHRVHFFRSAFS